MIFNAPIVPEPDAFFGVAITDVVGNPPAVNEQARYQGFAAGLGRSVVVWECCFRNLLAEVGAVR